MNRAERLAECRRALGQRWRDMEDATCDGDIERMRITSDVLAIERRRYDRILAESPEWGDGIPINVMADFMDSGERREGD
jgi:hypothetical protein